ncbi:MAG: YtxH domain-containing protein [Actinomycetota bacterium]|nr:YtxH domain-containing protein [Actinomycetota bacterium]
MCENGDSNLKRDRQYKSTGKNLPVMLIIVSLSVFSGFILGLLFAPQSGLKTRKIINEKLSDAIDRGKFTFTEAKVMGEELLEKSKEKAGKVSSIIRSMTGSDTD